jgi:hypothetical protein
MCVYIRYVYVCVLYTVSGFVYVYIRYVYVCVYLYGMCICVYIYRYVYVCVAGLDVITVRVWVELDIVQGRPKWTAVQPWPVRFRVPSGDFLEQQPSKEG